ncbi:HNH endonuclease domain-containing protein [Exiguobacterium sp. s133]|uniref:HNH endonuclease domain-containing protein n=1 Tax=Exiguobacterium sp. s133 TaxID=2751213 RepID=UPI001BEB4E42|nr:HNH endonuclease domain-containing protein [Exiguobacterium sp. s133]
MNPFLFKDPSLESYFRSVILFGKNSASYKFALAKSLLDVASDQSRSFVPLEELAVPFAFHICDHLKLNDKQTTAKSSTFLKACQDYNDGSITEDQLISITTKYGFVNVLDAFHNVNQNALPVSFFDSSHPGSTKGIYLTDDLYRLLDSTQSFSIEQEIEARWRLVETAWSLQLPLQLITIDHDPVNNDFFIHQTDQHKRIAITSSRPALNGYQKGKCFYCYCDISVITGSNQLADVDHFIPHRLSRYLPFNLDGVWNLVLSCQACNRGQGGKSAQLPHHSYLQRLHSRNEYLINSLHPLRETIINLTGATDQKRISFLTNIYQMSSDLTGPATWFTEPKGPAVF